MSKTPSTMIALGTKAPYFELENVRTGKILQFNKESEYKAILIFFICNHCPYVKHIKFIVTILRAVTN